MAKKTFQNLKANVENQLGIQAGADTPARQCGSVGGEMVKQIFASANEDYNAMKNEISSEMGIQMGPDTPARYNGSVGGEMVKRVIAKAGGTMPSGK